MAILTATQVDWIRRKRIKDTVRGAVFHAVAIALGFVMIYPLLWMLASSFKEPLDIWTNVSSLIPRDFTTEN